MGECEKAMEDFRAALKLQHVAEQKNERPLYSIWGYYHTSLLADLGQLEKATRLTKANKDMALREMGADAQDVPRCNLLLADLQREYPVAESLWTAAHTWAISRDAKDLLCLAARVRAQIERIRARYDIARSSIEDGLRIARECGYGIHHIALVLVRAQVALSEGRADDALQDVKVALDDGVHPPAETGFPELLAANDPECGYAWGIAEGRHLRGEALLLKAAQELGRSDFVPARLKEMPEGIQGFIAEARVELNAALDWWRKLRDPESRAKINPRGKRTEKSLKKLKSGVLSVYPLKSARSAEPLLIEAQPAPNSRSEPMPKKHVFLSYCHDNDTEVTQLRNDLIAAGEQIWWDKDILPGQDWKQEIRKAMRNAYTVVLCLSKELTTRVASGVYPEVLDAIAAYREYSPGGIFLIPIKLSECEVPLIEIDGTRTLDRLQFVDLHPPAKRASGLQQLVKSLKVASSRP